MEEMNIPEILVEIQANFTKTLTLKDIEELYEKGVPQMLFLYKDFMGMTMLNYAILH